MKASREWGPCSCNCGKSISTGDEFVMLDGCMYLVGHEERRTRQIPVVKRDEPPKKPDKSDKKKKRKEIRKDAEELSLFGE